MAGESGISKLKGLGALVVIVGVFVAGSMLPKPSAPDDLGCNTVRALSRWSSCELVEHRFSARLHGCSERDKHYYVVRGRNLLGVPARATVCCAELRGSCRVNNE